MAKRRNRRAKGKTRSPRAQASRLPGGRKVEMVREADPEGRSVTHARNVDTLARMLKAGTITPPMHDAARDFEAHFTIAAYDTTAPRDMIRVSASRRERTLSDNQVAARERVYRALEALGGIASPGGSCVWSVAGLGHSLREWALHQGWNGRPVHIHQATGVLITALGALAVHYGYERANSRARTTG